MYYLSCELELPLLIYFAEEQGNKESFSYTHSPTAHCCNPATPAFAFTVSFEATACCFCLSLCSGTEEGWEPL